MTSLPPLVESTPGKMGGETCFAGTRLPVSFLFSHLATGSSLEVFLREYPYLPRAVVFEVIRMAGRDMARPRHERGPGDTPFPEPTLRMVTR